METKKQKILYDLPSMVFEEYLKTAGISATTFEVRIDPEQTDTVTCRYAAISKNPGESLFLILIELPSTEYGCSVVIARNDPSMLNNDVLETTLFKRGNCAGNIRVHCVNHSTQLSQRGKMIGYEKILNIESEPDTTGPIKIMHAQSGAESELFLSLALAATKLYFNEEYEWVTAYISVGKGPRTATRINNSSLELKGREVLV